MMNRPMFNVMCDTHNTPINDLESLADCGPPCMWEWLIPQIFFHVAKRAWHLCTCVLPTDDDECSLGTDNCRNLGPTWQCRNKLGSFRCERKRCDGNKVLLSNGECKSIECPPGYEPSPQGQCVGKPLNNMQLFAVAGGGGWIYLWDVKIAKYSNRSLLIQS